MASDTDAAPVEPADRYAPLENHVVLTPPLGRLWMVPGGEEDDSGITLHVITSAPDGARPKRFNVRVPLDVDETQSLVVGTPLVDELT